jgi:hypothetical protein
VNDRDLKSTEVQALAGKDSIASFFALLGYDTEVRLPLTAAALGITAEQLQRHIKNIEQLAVQEDGAEPLYVYLVELTSVTIAATQGLARALKNRVGNYVLVLTDDYERLDFVLLERTLSQSNGSSLSPRQVSVRPRILTVHRRNPSPVHLRVLRRFTYTEVDSDAQYDKLLSAYTVAEWSEPLFNNRALFSDYYLNERLPELPEWQERPETIYHRFQALFADFREHLSGDSQATTRNFLVSAFETLGFRAVAVEDQQPYLLCAADAPDTPIALCLAYSWNRYLDGRDETRDTDSPEENPGARVVSALDSGEVPWAIVTNGKLWRLYSARAHSRATNYYEIDLEETLAMADPNESFRYFYLFFRAAAFVPEEDVRDGQPRQICFLDKLVEESETYAKGLGDRLKERVFEQIFPHFAEGFIEYLKRQPGIADPQQSTLFPVAQQLSLRREPDEAFRRLVFEGTLTLLYRLLFLLYAEARGLLPVREERGYFESSLTKLKGEVAEKAGNIYDEARAKLRTAYGTNTTDLYDRLLTLFAAIDRGRRDLNVPIYNGGLFITEPQFKINSPEAETARFLQNYKIPDFYLAMGLDLLARDVDDKRQDLVFIDYKSLGVRQLGSIYEGLLEFKIRIAPEKMAVVKGKRTEEVIPYKKAKKVLTKGRGRNAEERVYHVGEAYLENDRRERKATGSYYTPDHIVKYIVENAVGPMLEEKFEKLLPVFREAERQYRQKLQQAGALRAQGLEPDDPKKIAYTYSYLVDELFDLRVLDPAMGSGHFLVEVVDFICDRILGEREGFLQSFPWNPVTAFLDDTRQAIIAELERQKISVDVRRLTDINLLKRHVLKRCVYGVDLNQMAVELAKVSLWLDCFTIGAPLSFLDHHLKCGNSLIGTTVQEVQAELANQADLFGGPFQGLLAATATIEQLRRIPDATATEVENSRSLFADFEQAQTPYKAALNIWVSRHFGNQLAEEYLTIAGTDLVEQLHPEGSSTPPPKYRETINKAAEIGVEKCFFHWDLEFPEAFVDLKGGRWKLKEEQGFDAVVGNPPWGAELSNQDRHFVRVSYQSAKRGVVDNFAVFLENAHVHTCTLGYLGFLLPDIFLLKNYPSIRQYILENSQVEELIHWGTPFPEVNLDVCSIIAQKIQSPPDHIVRCVPEVRAESLKISNVNEIPQHRFLDQKSYKLNLGLTEDLQHLLEDVRCLGPRFGDLFVIREGIHSGNIRSKLFPFTCPSRNGQRLIFGRDEVRPFKISWSGRWVHYDKDIIDKSNNEYANLGNASLHKAHKILVRRTGDTLIAALDEQGFFVSNNLFLCVPKILDENEMWYCLTLLNSEFSTWFFQSIQPRAGRLFAELKINHLTEIPMVFLNSPYHKEWVIDIGCSLRELCQNEIDEERLGIFLHEFNLALWARLDREVEGMAVYRRKEN